MVGTSLFVYERSGEAVGRGSRGKGPSRTTLALCVRPYIYLDSHMRLARAACREPRFAVRLRDPVENRAPTLLGPAPHWPPNADISTRHPQITHRGPSEKPRHNTTPKLLTTQTGVFICSLYSTALRGCMGTTCNRPGIRGETARNQQAKTGLFKSPAQNVLYRLEYSNRNPCSSRQVANPPRCK